jgi:hypothetical protein
LRALAVYALSAVADATPLSAVLGKGLTGEQAFY